MKEKMKKIFRRDNINNIIIAALVVFMLVGIFSVLIPSFSGSDRNISRERMVSLNDGWKNINDGTEDISLPFSYEFAEDEESLILENDISPEYGGLAVVIRLRNAGLRVYLGNDDEFTKYYEKGLIRSREPGLNRETNAGEAANGTTGGTDATNAGEPTDQPAGVAGAGHSSDGSGTVTVVGSSENIIELPTELKYSKIRIEVIPVATNTGISIGSAEVTRYEILIVSLIESSLPVFFGCILIIVCCVIMFITDTIRVFSGWGKWELPLLIFFGMTCVAYTVMRLSLFEAVLGNGRFFNFASIFALANMPVILIAHFAKRGDNKQKGRFKYAIIVFLVMAIAFDLLFTLNTGTRGIVTACAISMILLILTAAVVILSYKGIRSGIKVKILEAGAYGILLAGYAFCAAEIFDADGDADYSSIQIICTTVFFIVITVINIISVISEYKFRSGKAEREAIAANEAKSAFLTSMSHEIRTPINAVLGMNEMILRESSEEEIIGYSESIRTAGTTLLGLINDILDFSKIESGKMDILTADYDLASVLNDLVNMVHTKAEAKGLELKMNIDGNTPKALYGDEMRIKQIITNILSNAVKYTEKGSITLTLGFDRIEDDEKNIMLNVRISDTGIGIKKEDMPKLFSEFERIEELRNRSIEGTGLGMSITQRLLALMGSTLEVESEYGKGSTFSFSVKQGVTAWDPVGDYAESFRRSLTERKTYKERFTAPDAHILVIDDTPMNLNVFVNLLKKTRVCIDTADSGDDGILMAQKNKYDLIFIDHMMPNKDGIETLGDIKKITGNKDTPCVCLTANAIAGARDTYIKAGFDDYLTKPIESSKLEKMMMALLPDEKVIPVSEDEIPDTEETTELPAWLYEIAEIDVNDGLEHCQSADALLDALKVYEASVASNAEEIEGYIGAGDLKNATVKIHALKSTSRIIGAKELGALAEKLENAGNANDADTLAAELPGLLQRYRALGKALAPISAEEEDESGLTPVDAGTLREMYTAIKEFLSVSDYDSAVDIIEGLKGLSVPEDEKQRRKELLAAAADIRYEDIVNILSDV